MADLMTPTVHLNGTSKKELLDGYLAAMSAVRDAQKWVGATAPNGRDYYVKGPGAINVAMDEHQARMERLQFVLDDLESIALAISDGGAR